MRKLFILCTVLICFLSLCALSASADDKALPLKLSSYEKGLTDKNEKKKITVKGEITVACTEPMDSLYLIFYDKTAEFQIRAGDREESFSAKYLRQYVSISELFGSAQNEVVLTFSQGAGLTELYGFSETLPSWVQVWKEPCEKADLCLMTTHADDEQLFFAGILPTYAGEKDFEVQVIYFTDHVNTPLRRHELLQGLWTVGVDHYPVIGPFPDLYSKNGTKAQNQLSAKGFSYEEIVEFQVEMLRRFKPLVVIGHDPKGEYGHGQHILNSATLQEAVLISANQEAYPESAEKYGVWDVPKTYLHLLKDNPITMDWDVPLTRFGGKTAFQVTQEGFRCHQSQHKYWFYGWLYGSRGSITRADQIKTYSPCNFGLFRSLVGEDVEKNDFFENQLSYGQIRQKEEEEEKLRLEEEKRKEEEKRLEQQQQKEQEKNTSRETLKTTATKHAEEKDKGQTTEPEKLFWIVAVTGSVIFWAIAFALVRGNRKRRK